MALLATLCLPLDVFSEKAKFGLSPDGMLDQPTLEKAYKESEWDQVTKLLEGYLRNKGDSRVSQEERIFAYKYLGVICAADSLSRSKAESYFTRLLNLSPDEDIVDLFPSRRVKDLFLEVKRENEELKRYSSRPKTSVRDSMPTVTAISTTQRDTVRFTPKQSKPNIQEPKSTWIWWTVGIAAATGAGVGAYYLSSNEPEKSVETLTLQPE